MLAWKLAQVALSTTRGQEGGAATFMASVAQFLMLCNLTGFRHNSKPWTIGITLLFLIPALACERSPADKYVDQQMDSARQQGIQVSPEEERQARAAAQRGYEIEKEQVKRAQQEDIRRGVYVPDPIR